MSIPPLTDIAPSSVSPVVNGAQALDLARLRDETIPDEELLAAYSGQS